MPRISAPRDRHQNNASGAIPTRGGRRGLTVLAADERLADARCARDDVTARSRSRRWTATDYRTMDDLYDAITAGTELSSAAASALHERGFVVLPGPVASTEMEHLTSAYDATVASASVHDVHTGGTTTRVNDFVNRGNEFDTLYVFPPLLEACCRTIGRGFKLSSMHARTLRTRTLPRKNCMSTLIALRPIGRWSASF